MSKRTFAIIKPDAVRQGGATIGQIFSMAATAGLHPVEMMMSTPDRVFWEEFYQEHQGKPFYDELLDFMCSGPSIFILFQASGIFDAIKRWRKTMGATDPQEADPMTIRRIFGHGGPANVVHGSDSPESFKREMDLAFPPKDQLN